MTDSPSAWLVSRLNDQLIDLPRVLACIPTARWTQLPPDDLGAWSVHRHLVHLTSLEGRAALPVLRHLIEGLPVDPRYTGTPEQRGEVQIWERAPEPGQVLDQWQTARRAILRFLEPIPIHQWNRAVPHPAVGPISIEWYLLKIYQHTLDHLNAFAKLALWWDVDLRPKLDYNAL